ncbi:glutamate-5-semialdehyde dehydrogenase [Malassezia cuniculi]|uniref:glutamate-5-semialdehyde dehydrogenase n=1 Tax=Malassezia cuniculi TaxID=948313 RepID=A0AAF0J607_9BASI|nr:glutamate-5-semialdehyde dehydrogenase [Malassezia cuniculi]
MSHATVIARQAREAYDEAQKALSSLRADAADASRVQALELIRAGLEARQEEIREANRRDVAEATELAEQGRLSRQLVSRLDLFAKAGKWESMLQGVSDVARLPSPLDICRRASRLAEAETGSNARPASGNLDLYQVTCPIGVLLCIFEARPEVIINIASLAIKSGNAAILKGGKESRHTAAVLSSVLASALEKSALPRFLVQTVETRDEIQALLHEEDYIDLVIPRGSNALVKSIQREARMPVMGHADGLCAAYVHDDAVPSITIPTILDAKTDYPSACNAIETLLVNRAHLTSGLWEQLVRALVGAGVKLYLDEALLAAAQKAVGESDALAPVEPEHFDTEFLDLALAARVVDSVDEAIDHINAHGSGHTDIILCAPLGDGNGASHPAAEAFTRSLSSSSVFVNASSRFADGFRYGFGTEVGISTGRTHARGPVGLEGLVIYKYVLRASGDGPQTAGAFNGENARPWAHTALEPRYPTM